jgi:segregation and condensation protein B
VDEPLSHSATATESGSSTEPVEADATEADATVTDAASTDAASTEAATTDAVNSVADDAMAADDATVDTATAAVTAEGAAAATDVADTGAADTGAATAPDTDEAGDDEAIEDALQPLSDADLETALEALLLVVDVPAEEEALATALNTTPLRVAEHLRLLSDKYTDHDRGIDLRRAGGGWRFYTRDRYAPYVEKFLLDGQRAKLTRAALETLAVIAYRQPVTRARVAAVRGVNCDGVIRTLLARGLVEETGTDVETGGFLYRTTELFLERLGLSSLDDLPPIAPLLPEVDSIDEL